MEKVTYGLEELSTEIKKGVFVLFEGGLESKKDVICHLLLKQALEEKIPVGLISFNSVGHATWFNTFAGKEQLDLLTIEEANSDLCEFGLQVSRVSEKCRILFTDVFSVITAKAEVSKFVEMLTDKIKKLRGKGVAFVGAVDPGALEGKYISRLAELAEIVIEVEGRGERIAWKYEKHPVEETGEWHEVLHMPASIPKESLLAFASNALELELFNVLHYGKALPKFEKEDSGVLLDLTKASLNHAASFLEMIQEAGECGESSKEELLAALRRGLQEERTAKEEYVLGANQFSQKSGILLKIASQEKEHEEKVENLIEKIK